MRTFILLFSLIILSQCRIGQSSTGDAGSASTAKKSELYGPDQCRISAKVIREERPGVYSLRVYEVMEAGFGFDQNINPGDKIEVSVALPIPEKEITEMIIEWVKSKDGGYYEMSTGAM